jgi:hypothetical protein
MYNITFPDWSYDDGVINDYQYYISPPTLSDYSCFAFAVSDSNIVRILAAKLNYIKEESSHDLNNIVINETFINRNELDEIILELDRVLG